MGTAGNAHRARLQWSVDIALRQVKIAEALCELDARAERDVGDYVALALLTEANRALGVEIALAEGLDNMSPIELMSSAARAIENRWSR